jgi:TctA family transporter
MSNSRLQSLVQVLIISSILGIIIGAVIPSKSDNATYTIISENGEKYYSNEFRMYGKGIVFTDVYGKTVIIQGDLEIVKKPEKK